MEITNPALKFHLTTGGLVKLKTITWAFAQLHGENLLWYDLSTGTFLGRVDDFNDLVSKEWEIIDENTLCRRMLPKSI